jgi:Ca2+-binding EF-hand superfamily protein
LWVLVVFALQTNFERFDRDRSGKIDPNELREALMSLGFAVSPVVLDLLVSKFDKTGGKNKAIEYDNFIEYVFLGLVFNLLLFLFDK